VFVIVAAIAQLERSLIVERVKAGLRRARADGGAGASPKEDGLGLLERQGPHLDRVEVERLDGQIASGTVIFAPQHNIPGAG